MVNSHTIFTDQQVSTARVVMNLEKMVIREAQRSLTYLSLFGYAVDSVVVNRILSPEVDDGHFSSLRAMQQEYALQVNEMFQPLPILRAPHFSHEIVGTELLSTLADKLFGNDPAAFLYQGPMQRIEKAEGGYDLIVPLPFTSEDQVHFAQNADELLISVEWRQNMASQCTKTRARPPPTTAEPRSSTVGRRGQNRPLNRRPYHIMAKTKEA